MTRGNAMEEGYEVVTLFGQPCLFTSIRINRDTIPPGMELYELRYGDEDPFTPCEIARAIWAQHYGTLITNKPIELMEGSPIGPRRYFEESDFQIQPGHNTMAEFMELHPPEKPAQQQGPAPSTQKKRKSEPDR